MNSPLYGIYRRTARLKEKYRSRVSSIGSLCLLLTGLAILFGLNTRETMLYQLAGFTVVLSTLSFVLSLFFSTSIKIRRILPETCTAGVKLRYLLQVETRGTGHEKGLFFTESSGAGYPSYAEFSSPPEGREKERNWFDRTFGYYHWLWLLRRLVGARLNSFPLPDTAPGMLHQVEISLIPLRRGYLYLKGYTVHRLDPFGLFKKEIFFARERKLLVLPKTYPVVPGEFSGSRKYNQGGAATAAGSGESGEFIALREYRAGDPVKHMDWKATARTGKAMVREYQEEYFSCYGVVLDTFADQPLSILLEEAISVAASIVVAEGGGTGGVELLLSADHSVTVSSADGRIGGQHQLLEVLACMASCREKNFAALTNRVMGHAHILSGLVLVLLKMDEKRGQLVKLLEQQKIPYTVIVISADKKETEKQLAGEHIVGAQIFMADTENQMVSLR